MGLHYVLYSSTYSTCIHILRNFSPYGRLGSTRSVRRVAFARCCSSTTMPRNISTVKLNVNLQSFLYLGTECNDILCAVFLRQRAQTDWRAARNCGRTGPPVVVQNISLDLLILGQIYVDSSAGGVSCVLVARFVSRPMHVHTWACWSDCKHTTFFSQCLCFSEI